MIMGLAVKEICSLAKNASFTLAGIPTQIKNAALTAIKNELLSRSAEVLSANAVDMEKARAGGMNAAYLDRLLLTPERIEGIAASLNDIAALPDPVGEVVETTLRPNGLKIKKVRAPLGVIGIIFEARPNVSIEAAALCIKSGNAVVLRGSRASAESVAVLIDIVKKGLCSAGISEYCVGLVEGDARSLTIDLLKADEFIDVVIPRGGDVLKKVVFENAAMPVIASFGGNCHQYVAKSGDEDTAIQVALNAKLSRPSTCNALETLLIDREKGDGFIIKILSALKDAGVTVRVTEEIAKIFPTDIIEKDEFYKEYDAPTIKVGLVSGVKEAIAHINKYGTHHSDAIISCEKAECDIFTATVDSAAVYVNASTRFTDGFEFGLGAEMGISTQKLHVRGPIGLKELTSTKYVVIGDGTIRV